MNTLVWILLTLLLVELAHSWLFRRRLKAQHEMMATLYRDVAQHRRADAERWLKKANDTSASANERQLAYGRAAGAIGNAISCDDIAADIEHVLVNGKSLQSRAVAMNEEIARLERVAENTIIFTSKGGDA